MHGKPRDRKHVITSLVAVVAMVTGVIGPLPAAFAATPGGKKPRVLVLKTQKAVDVGNLVTTKISAYMDQILGMDQTIEVVAPSTLVIPAIDAVDATKPVKPAKPAKPKPATKPVAKAGKDLIAEGDAAAEKGKSLLKKKPADAVKQFTKALELYGQDAGRLEDFGKYVDALAGRAAAYFASGYDDNGEEELAKVLAVSPGFAPPSDAPESMAAAFPRVKQRLAPSGAQIKVTADVANTVVILDGTSRGPAPQTIGGLLAGDHHIRVLANGRQAFGQIVTLGEVSVDVSATLPMASATDNPVSKPEETAPVAETPKPVAPKADDLTGLEFYVRAGNLDTGFQAQAKRIAQANKLDAIYFSYVRGSGKDYDLGMFVWKADDGRIAAIPPVRLSGDLAGLQVDVLDACDKAGAVMRKFPDELALTGRAPIFNTSILLAEKPEPEPEWHPDTKPVEPVKPEPVKPVRDPNKPVVVAPSIEARPKDSLDTMVRTGPEHDIASVTAPDVPKRKKRDDDAVYEKWWFWTLVVGVVGGSATAIALTQGGGTADPEGFKTTVSW